MVDFADFFRLSDPVGNKPYRGEIEMTSEEAWSVSRGEHIPSKRAIVRWAMGGAVPSDVIWTTLAAPLIISSRVTDVLNAGGFSGWDVFPVTVYDKRKIEVPNYFILAIKGRCNPIDLSRSEVVLREYPGGWFPEFKGAYFPEESWDGSDLFIERPDELGRLTMSRFATGRVVRALRQIPISNLSYESLVEDQVSVSVYECGSAHKLPHDIARRVEDAYEKAGVPRPPRQPSKAVRTRNDFVEHLLNDDDIDELTELYTEAARRINVAQVDDPETIVKKIMQYVDQVRPLVGDALDDQALVLGCLWAQQVLRVTNWTWAEIQKSGGSPTYGIVSADRAVVTFPVSYIRELLADEGRDNTALLLFNMVRSGNFPDCEPGAYQMLG